MNKLDKKIEESKNMPKELKDKIDETFFYNNLEAITMMFYFAILNYAFLMCTVKDFTNYCKIFSIYAAIISVVIFEVAYKKDRFKLAIIGIEVLVTATITAFIPYIYAYQERAVRGVVMTVPLLYAVYFLTKTSLYYISKQKKYRDESITDIKEILDDKDEKVSYLDDETSTKIIKEEKEKKDNKEKKSRKVKNKKNNDNKEIHEDVKEEVEELKEENIEVKEEEKND